MTVAETFLICGVHPGDTRHGMLSLLSVIGFDIRSGCTVLCRRKAGQKAGSISG